jgi:hypothetical protein
VSGVIGFGDGMAADLDPGADCVPSAGADDGAGLARDGRQPVQ